MLFDLDGTLTDPSNGIYASIRSALTQLGRPLPDREELRGWVGPPLHRSFRERAGLSGSEAVQAVRHYRAHFEAEGIRQNRLQPGAPEILRKLSSAGVLVLLATSKPRVYAEQILEGFDLHSEFDGIFGASLDAAGAEKGEVVAEALDFALGLRSRAVMVGDRADDVLAARDRGLPSIGVGWGFAAEGELEAAGATWLVDDMAALARRLGV
ncbi:MAG: HAD hydrolase-like protein [Myxococcota bacterium]